MRIDLIKAFLDLAHRYMEPAYDYQILNFKVDSNKAERKHTAVITMREWGDKEPYELIFTLSFCKANFGDENEVRIMARPKLGITEDPCWKLTITCDVNDCLCPEFYDAEEKELENLVKDLTKIMMDNKTYIDCFF